MKKWLIASLVGALVSAGPVLAGQANGETFFNTFPVLRRASTDNNSSTYNYARYSFAVGVPVGSGEALGRLRIGIPEPIDLPDPGQIRAVDGDGQEIPLSSVQADGRTIEIAFAQPVPPGRQTSIEFYPMRNPRFGGTYLFEVTAFPSGPAPRGQFLSYGRLQFISPGGGHR